MLINTCSPDCRQAIFTITDANYTAMSITMFTSVKKYYPDSECFLIIIGEGESRKVNDWINIIYIKEILEEHDLNQRLAFFSRLSSQHQYARTASNIFLPKNLIVSFILIQILMYSVV
ncbi:hypothetical protein [Escherichia coli]|uniref:hypothetical protein n=1 Tax=Escherichia coli TaxID=562 RepID=UPI0020406469|nr:hypothetical protein [Escherichia coli]